MNMDEIKGLAENSAIKIDVNETANAMIGAMMANIREQAVRAGAPPETGIVGVYPLQLIAVATSTFVNMMAQVYASDCGDASLGRVLTIGHGAVVAAMNELAARHAIDPIKKHA